MHKHVTNCLHCNSPNPPNERFCCSGCKFVYNLLKENNLSSFYKIKQNDPNADNQLPIKEVTTSYSYLDDQKEERLSFYLEGVHCSACIWLIEKLDIINPDVDHVSLNFGTSVVTIKKKKEGTFSSIATTLAQLGYPPHLLDDQETAQLRKKETIGTLLKIGLSGACMGNIMLFTIPSYAGLTGPLETVFSFISGLTFLPILFFTTTPFYQGAWKGVRQRKFNIDMTVSIAFLLGGALSYLNLFLASGELYFDSLSMFCFLLLSSRYFYKKAFESFNTDDLKYSAFIPKTVNVDGRDISVASLKKDHLISIQSESIIPVDGVLDSESAIIDAHILNGESTPITIKKGESLYAGMKNVGTEISLRVTAIGQQTRLGKLLTTIQSYSKPRVIQLADRLAKLLLICILLLALYVAITQGADGMNTILALIILGCPCALSLAMPLTFLHAIKAAADKGICIKNPDIFEKVNRVDTVFLDKTGTLTEGQMSLSSEPPPSLFYRQLIYSMEKDIQHPIATALKRAFYTDTPLDLDQITSHVGKGVSASYESKTYWLMSHSPTSQKADSIMTSIGLFENDRCLHSLELSDQLLPDGKSSISWLKDHHIRPILLSGDQEHAVKHVAKRLGIDDYHASCSPEQKRDLCSTHPFHIMIGDGANDALSLSQAYISIAVRGALDISLNVSDIYFRNPGIKSLPYFITLSRHTNRLVKINYAIAFLFNTIGVTLVLVDKVTPLVAAILMPLSSVSIYLISKYTYTKSS